MENNVGNVLDSISVNNVAQSGYAPPKKPWETPPPDLDGSLISGEAYSDVVVVGAGLSGLSAALRCTQLGRSVTVLEKGNSISARGGQMGALRSSVMDALDIHIDQAQFVRDWIRQAGNRCREELVWLFAKRSGEAMDWLIALLQARGVETVLYGGYYKGPDYTEYPGTHMFVRTEKCTAKQSLRSVPLVAELLRGAAAENGAVFRFNTRALRLEKTAGRVTAVIAAAEDGGYVRFRAGQAVILATGDIAADKAMLAAYAPLGLKPEYCAYTPAGLNTGDGHKLGLWAGGVFEDAPWPLTLHLLPYALHTFFFLYVDRRGRRFMNEDTWVQARAIQCLNQSGAGDWAFSVFDSRWADELEQTVDISGGQFCDSLTRRYGEPWNREDAVRSVAHYIKRGVGYQADSIEALAEKMGVPAAALCSSVARYNRMAAAGRDSDFGKRPELLFPIDKPPYCALKWGASLLNANGGLLVDPRLRVLTPSGDAIGGLYAVGNVSGGLYGVDYPVLLNGNSHGRALTWGYVAAESIAAAEK